jgi:hypothetical protein
VAKPKRKSPEKPSRGRINVNALILQVEFVKKLIKSKESDDIWGLHDFLTEKRNEVDEKYDYRFSVLDFVFSRLI